MPPKYTKEQKLAYQARKKLVTKAKKTGPKLQAVKGHGDYRPTQFARVKGRGDYLGDLLGGLAAKAGNLAGNALQGGFRKLTGFGDYQSRGPKKNSLYKAPSAQPSENSFTMGSMSVKFAGAAPRVQHREFIGPVMSTGSSFNTKVYRVQPGLTGIDVLFPWGSSVAGCFQQYVLHGAILEYVTTSSDFASNSALGTVMMSMIYDAEQTPLASQIAVDNNEYTTTAKPSVSFYHPLECSPKENSTDVRYIRKSNASVSGQDERLDDFGIFQLSTNGLSATAGTQIGELWITYDLELLKAELPDVHAGTSFQVDGTSGSSVLNMSTVTQLNPGNSLPVVVTFPNTGQVKLQLPVGYNGNYLITIAAQIVAPTPTAWSIGAVSGSDITWLTMFPGSYVPNAATNINATGGANLVFVAAFSTIATTAANNYINFNAGGTYTGAGGGWSYIITALDNDIAAKPPTELQKLLMVENRIRNLLEHTVEEEQKEHVVSEDESEVFVPDPLSNSTLLNVLRDALRK